MLWLPDLKQMKPPCQKSCVMFSWINQHMSLYSRSLIKIQQIRSSLTTSPNQCRIYCRWFCNKSLFIFLSLFMMSCLFLCFICHVTCGTMSLFSFSEANSSQTCCFYASIEHFVLRFFLEHNASHKYSWLCTTLHNTR